MWVIQSPRNGSLSTSRDISSKRIVDYLGESVDENMTVTSSRIEFVVVLITNIESSDSESEN